jgi:transposase
MEPTNCHLTADRDVNAARKNLARGLRFKPVESAHEAMLQKSQRRVILKADADQSTSKPSNEPRS